MNRGLFLIISSLALAALLPVPDAEAVDIGFSSIGTIRGRVEELDEKVLKEKERSEREKREREEEALEIRDLEVTTTSEEAVVSWRTEIESMSRIRYGLTPDYGNLKASTEDRLNHSFTLTGLQGGTTYYYKAVSFTGERESSRTGFFLTEE